MEYCLDSVSMKQCDKFTIETIGIPSMVLMERAALTTATEIVSQTPIEQIHAVIFAGTGNNGGDGVAVGRILYQWGADVVLALVGDSSKYSTDMKQQLAIAQGLNIPLVNHNNLPAKEYNTVVDAIFGIGLSREVTGEFALAIAQINQLGQQARVYAVDIPSGIHTDTGECLEIAVKAQVTVTFQYPKAGLYLQEGRECSGNVKVKDIGIIKEPESAQVKAPYITFDKEDLSRLPKRSPQGHKGSFGRVAVYAGSYDMAGAAYFAADAAYRSGCGMVELITHERNRTVLMEKLPEAVFTCYANEEEKSTDAPWKQAVNRAQAVIIGPGLGTSDKAEEILSYVLQTAKVPCVIDADGINLLAHHKEWVQQCNAPCILTPHIKELSRLSDCTVDEVKKNYGEIAAQEAKKLGCVIVAKSHRSIVVTPQDTVRYLNLSGCDGMATAGSGDVLAGIIGGLSAQGMNPFEAASLGVYIHGLAGEAAAEQYSNYSMKASDIINNLYRYIK